MSWSLVTLLLGLTGLAAGVIYFVRRALSDRVALDERDASLQAESERVHAMEAAEAKARDDRRRKFDEDAAVVRNASDAAELLREATRQPSPR